MRTALTPKWWPTVVILSLVLVQTIANAADPQQPPPVTGDGDPTKTTTAQNVSDSNNSPSVANASTDKGLPSSFHRNDAQSAVGAETNAGQGTAAVKPGLEVFSQYVYRQINTNGGGSNWYHQFEATRVHASIAASHESVYGRVVLEGVRSASEGALMGVAGDSMVLRVREAFGSITPLGWLNIRAGIVPTMTIPALERTWTLRAVSAVPLEQTGMLTPADAGASVRALLPLDMGFVGVASYNGEGYTNRDLNRGKSTELAAELHPLVPIFPATKPLGILISYVNGSTGAVSARADRFTIGLLWRSEKIGIGTSYTQGWGLDDIGTKKTWLVDAFARAEPFTNVLMGLRFFLWQRDLTTQSDKVTSVTGTIGYRLYKPLEIFAASTRTMPGKIASQALPNVDTWDWKVVARVWF